MGRTSRRARSISLRSRRATRRAHLARTPGSYNVIRWPGDGHGWAVCEVDGLIVRADAIRSDAEADAAFFAGASRDIPALIAEVERLTMPNGTVTASVIAT